MRLTKIITYIALLALTIYSCIKPFEAEIKGTDLSLYVVSGRITDLEGYQYVNVSISSDVNAPSYLPVTGCQAEIQDELGHAYPLEEEGNGSYRIWMRGLPGMAYRVRLVTLTGQEIVSGFDRMPFCPEVDSIYFETDEVSTTDPGQPVLGIRFFADLDATGMESRFFKWELEETWEYHMDFAKEWYYDGAMNKIDPPDKSTQVCWYTGQVADIFTVSTSGLQENIYRRYPLHFVDNRTTKLTHIYSLLVKQYAISDLAYEYWDKLRTNSQSQGGLYEQQPLPVEGNLFLADDPGARVLGFFEAASVTTKRVFVSDVPGLELDPRPLCAGPMELGIFGFSDFDPSEYPVYFTRIDGTIYTLADDCVDCRLHGGVNVKPVCWPE